MDRFTPQPTAIPHNEKTLPTIPDSQIQSEIESALPEVMLKRVVSKL